MAKKPLVLDLSHHNTVTSFAEVYAHGVRGIIHKASQGSGMVDKKYLKRRLEARAAGLLWGAYHFADDSDVKAQAANFLKASAWDDRTLLCLDWEPNGKRTMSVAQAKEFLKLVYDKTGQRPVLYSGNLIKEQVKTADPFLCQHRLWIAQYGPKATLPKGWSGYWLWQYTEAYSADCGVTGNVDANVFGGVNLALEWVEGRPNLSVAVDNTKAAEPDPVSEDKPSRIEKAKELAKNGVEATKRGAKSWDVWARVLSFLALLLSYINDWMKDLFSGAMSLVDLLPDMTGQVESQLMASEKMMGWLGIPWAQVNLGLVVALSGFIIYKTFFAKG